MKVSFDNNWRMRFKSEIKQPKHNSTLSGSYVLHTKLSFFFIIQNNKESRDRALNDLR